MNKCWAKHLSYRISTHIFAVNSHINWSWFNTPCYPNIAKTRMIFVHSSAMNYRRYLSRENTASVVSFLSECLLLQRWQKMMKYHDCDMNNRAWLVTYPYLPSYCFFRLLLFRLGGATCQRVDSAFLCLSPFGWKQRSLLAKPRTLF